MSEIMINEIEELGWKDRTRRKSDSDRSFEQPRAHYEFGLDYTGISSYGHTHFVTTRNKKEELHTTALLSVQKSNGLYEIRRA
jgi:hypothetical protein